MTDHAIITDATLDEWEVWASDGVLFDSDKALALIAEVRRLRAAFVEAHGRAPEDCPRCGGSMFEGGAGDPCGLCCGD